MSVCAVAFRRTRTPACTTRTCLPRLRPPNTHIVSKRSGRRSKWPLGCSLPFSTPLRGLIHDVSLHEIHPPSGRGLDDRLPVPQRGLECPTSIEQLREIRVRDELLHRPLHSLDCWDHHLSLEPLHFPLDHDEEVVHSAFRQLLVAVAEGEQEGLEGLDPRVGRLPRSLRKGGREGNPRSTTLVMLSSSETHRGDEEPTGHPVSTVEDEGLPQ